VECLLKRPPSPDGFIEALCRLVRDGVDVLTGVEVAQRVGEDPGAIDQITTQLGFPASVFSNAGRGIWRRQDVDDYLARRKTSSGG